MTKVRQQIIDAAEQQGINRAAFSEAMRRRLRAMIPDIAVGKADWDGLANDIVEDLGKNAGKR